MNAFNCWRIINDVLSTKIVKKINCWKIWRIVFRITSKMKLTLFFFYNIRIKKNLNMCVIFMRNETFEVLIAKVIYESLYLNDVISSFYSIFPSLSYLRCFFFVAIKSYKASYLMWSSELNNVRFHVWTYES